MTNPGNNAITENKEITKTQANFLDYLKKFGWGKIEVTVVNGEPVGCKELERTHRFDT